MEQKCHYTSTQPTPPFPIQKDSLRTPRVGEPAPGTLFLTLEVDRSDEVGYCEEIIQQASEFSFLEVVPQAFLCHVLLCQAQRQTPLSFPPAPNARRQKVKSDTQASVLVFLSQRKRFGEKENWEGFTYLV